MFFSDLSCIICLASREYYFAWKQDIMKEPQSKERKGKEKAEKEEEKKNKRK